MSFGLYARVLQDYGLLGRLTVVVDARFDAAGLAMERARLPRRIHLRPVQEDLTSATSAR